MSRTSISSTPADEDTVGIFVATASTVELVRFIEERAGNATNLAVMLGVAAGVTFGNLLGSLTGQIVVVLLLMMAGGLLGFVVGRSAGGAMEAALRLVARGAVPEDARQVPVPQSDD